MARGLLQKGCLRTIYYSFGIRQNWSSELGLVGFDHDKQRLLHRPQSAGDRMEFDRLYRRSKLYEDGCSQPWHHWIYVATHPVISQDELQNEWDKAFDELVKYHYAYPPAYNASFHYISCPGRPFCDLWALKAPSLIHFKTETATSDRPNFIRPREEVLGYDTVTARIIELPITNPGKLALPPGVFPSPFDQLKAVTDNEGAWKVHFSSSFGSQLIQRAQDDLQVKVTTTHR